MIAARKLDVLLVLNIACFSISMGMICPYSQDLVNGKITEFRTCFHRRFANTTTYNVQIRTNMMIMGCKCPGSTVECEGLSAMPVVRTEVNITVDTITILEGRLDVINKKDIPTGIIKIEISKNPLNFISEDAFNNSVTTLQEVIISGANFSQLPAALFKLPNLRSLTIADMRYRDWDVSPLENTSTAFRSLSLVNVQLSAWPGWFSSFRLLTKIDFSSNPFKSIPNDAFSSVKDTLEDVSLANTELTAVPTALRILRNVTYLRLSNNNIINVNGRPGIEELNLFPCATTLTSLEIESMGLNMIPNFSSLTNLITLKLANNLISDTVDVHVSQSLTTLDLFSNKLSSVPAFITNLSSLTYLDLSNNQITTITSDVFPLSLTALDLSANKITDITDFSFRNLSLLKSLYLQNNTITTISNSAFISLEALITLFISDNLLSRLPLALASLFSLEYLYIEVQSCPCPTESQLVSWYINTRNLRVRATGFCGSNISVVQVLGSYCQPQLSTTSSAENTRSGSTSYTGTIGSGSTSYTGTIGSGSTSSVGTIDSSSTSSVGTIDSSSTSSVGTTTSGSTPVIICNLYFKYVLFILLLIFHL